MRWVERLWRDDGRVKATPARVAASLAEGVTQSTNVLRARLEEQGLSRADRKRFESEACILECLLFEWFLRDISVPLEFGRHTDTIQHALAGRLAADLDRSGLSPSSAGFRAASSRALSRVPDAIEASTSLQALGALAWRRIADTDTLSDRMTMFLAMRATAELQALRGLGKRYILITAPRSFFSAPREE